MAPHPARSQRLVLGFIGVLASDAAFDAVALYPIAESTRWGTWAKRWTKDDLDRLGFPERFRFVFPIVKTSLVAGLLAGLRWRRLGRVTAAAVVAYFIAALGFHVRAKDRALDYMAAVGMFMWSCQVLRAMRSGPT